MTDQQQTEKPITYRTFEVIYPKQPHRNRSFKARGICAFDVLNPCWDNRKTDKPGLHWGSEPGMEIPACAACTRAAGASHV